MMMRPMLWMTIALTAAGLTTSPAHAQFVAEDADGAYDEADPAAGRIAFTAPLGRALMGAEVGEALINIGDLHGARMLPLCARAAKRRRPGGAGAPARQEGVTRFPRPRRRPKLGGSPVGG